MEEQELRPHGRRRQPAKLFSPTPPRAVNIGECRRAAGPLTAFEVHEKTRKNLRKGSHSAAVPFLKLHFFKKNMHLKQRLIIASALLAAAQAQAAIINFDELDCDYSNARTDYTFAAG